MKCLDRLRKIALASLLLLPTFTAEGVGFSILEVPDNGSKSIAVGVWYPSNSIPPTAPNTTFNQGLSLDTKINVQHAPLVVLSHGFGGWMGGHADTALALAEAGFVVAAPSHTGNTYKDMSSSTDQWLLDRPRQVSLVIDHMQKEWNQSAVVKDSKIGAFGFSAGGQTALSLIGAVPNLPLAASHCESNPTEFVCREGFIQQILAAKMVTLPSDAWGADSRITAVAIAAPGFGIAYDKQALANVSTPIQLWSAMSDNRVPHDSNVQPIADILGELSENHWVEKAGHFAFILQSCTEKLKKFEPETWDFLCVDEDGFDRKAFHEHMNTEMARFFKAHLQ